MDLLVLLAKRVIKGELLRWDLSANVLCAAYNLKSAFALVTSALSYVVSAVSCFMSEP